MNVIKNHDQLLIVTMEFKQDLGFLHVPHGALSNNKSKLLCKLGCCCFISTLP